MDATGVAGTTRSAPRMLNARTGMLSRRRSPQASASWPLRNSSRARHPATPPHPLLIEVYRLLDLFVVACTLLFLLTRSDAAHTSWRAVLTHGITISDVLLLGVFLVIWHACFVAVELYDARRLVRWRDEAQRLFAGVLPGTTILFAYLALPPGNVRLDGVQLWSAVGTFTAVTYFGTLAARSVLRLARLPHASSRAKSVLVVGSGPRAQRVVRTLASEPHTARVIGFVDAPRRDTPAEVEQQTLGALDQLEAVLMHHAVDEVVIALPVRSKYVQIQDALRTCARMGVDVSYPADVFEWKAPGAARSLESVSLHAVSSDYRRLIKRPIELVIALASLVVLAPLLVLIGAAIKLQDGGPIFFVQPRHGLHRREFRMFKFRTMVPGAETMQAALEDNNEASGAVFKIRRDPRVTRIGAWLRRTSLDELPQLFNVLTGEMSIVGPRPLPLRDVSHFEQSAPMRRFSVRPGITGLWQVSGRSDLGFADLVALDLRYIDEWSLWLDLKIVLRTVSAVLQRRGAA